jgi:hypothetical protein
MTNEERPTTAFLLSLVAGVFIILGGGMMSMLGYGFMGMMDRYGGLGGSYGRWGGMMGPGFGMMGFAFGMMGFLGLIFGVIVIISALMLNSKPQEHTTWGTLVLIFSVISIFGSAMGGFGIGLILGIIGGILAITWKPPEKK